MSRQPTPGGDSGTWGDVLNDYLGVSLAADGTMNAGVVGATVLSSGAATAGYVATATGWGSATWAAVSASITPGSVGATALASGAATTGQVPLATGWGSATWGTVSVLAAGSAGATVLASGAATSGQVPLATGWGSATWGTVSAVTAGAIGATALASGAATIGQVPVATGWGSATWTSLNGSQLTLTDVTTNNSTTGQHGFLPKLDSSATKVFLGDGTWGLGALYATNVQTSGYTPVTTDHGKIIEVSNAQGATITIPANASQAFPVGSYFGVMQQGAGQVVFLAASGATILSPSSKLKITGQYSSAAIRKQLTDTWILAGDITT